LSLSSLKTSPQQPSVSISPTHWALHPAQPLSRHLADVTGVDEPFDIVIKGRPPKPVTNVGSSCEYTFMAGVVMHFSDDLYVLFVVKNDQLMSLMAVTIPEPIPLYEEVLDFGWPLLELSIAHIGWPAKISEALFNELDVGISSTLHFWLGQDNGGVGAIGITSGNRI
jgi:hypothetical protein